MSKLLLILLLTGPLTCRYSNVGNIEEARQFFAQLDDGYFSKNKFFLIDSIEIIKPSGFITEEILKDTILPRTEAEFIVSQFSEQKKKAWNNTIFDSAKIVSQKYIDSLNGNVQEKDLTSDERYNLLRYRFSLPYFSKNKMYCLLTYERFDCFFCEEYSIKIFKKIDGKWVFLKDYISMVS